MFLRKVGTQLQIHGVTTQQTSNSESETWCNIWLLPSLQLPQTSVKSKDAEVALLF